MGPLRNTSRAEPAQHVISTPGGMTVPCEREKPGARSAIGAGSAAQYSFSELSVAARWIAVSGPIPFGGNVRGPDSTNDRMLVVMFKRLRREAELERSFACLTIVRRVVYSRLPDRTESGGSLLSNTPVRRS